MRTISKAWVSGILGTVLLLGVSGCASENSPEENQSTPSAGQESQIGPIEGTGDFVVPLPSEEAKVEFDTIARNSGERFFQLGVVEVYVGEEEFTHIYVPDYELGQVAAIVFETEEGEVGADYVYSFDPFSPYLALDLVAQLQENPYNVTKVDSNTFVIADTLYGSRTFYVENNLISGIQLLDNTTGEVAGRSYVQYLVGQAETAVIDQLVASSTDEELENIFNPPNEDTSATDDVIE